MFDVLRADEIGMSVTDSLAMLPAASVSGFYLAHPDSTYFSVGKIGGSARGLRAAHGAVARRRAPRARAAALIDRTAALPPRVAITRPWTGRVQHANQSG